MTADGLTDLGSDARIVSLTIADEPSAWESAGFTVIDAVVSIAGTTIELIGRTDDRAGRGIRGWTVSGLAAPVGTEPIDGIVTTFIDPAGIANGGGGGDHEASTAPPTAVNSPHPTDTTRPTDTTQPTGATRPADAMHPTGAPHPNGTAGIDHVVILTPDLDRTLESFAAVGLQVRRIRDTESYGSPMRQAFIRIGPVIVEVVGGHEGTGQSADEAPAGWFGLALDVADLDATAALLGEGMGGIKSAVQEGRRIATIRHKQFGISVATALMDDRG